jgi:hypothetical protein
MPEIAVVGPGEYEDVVVEIEFPAFTAVVRNERSKFFLEIFNSDASQLDDFAAGRKNERNSVDLESFLASLERAKALLAYQSNPQV